MINFEESKLHVQYVFITKITSSFVYIYGIRDKEGRVAPYEGGSEGTHFDMDIKKVRLHGSVFARFKQNNRVSQFSTPRLATLNFYDKNIISIETQKYDLNLKGFSPIETWKSDFDKAIPSVIRKTTKARDNGCQVFINGEDIFWLNKFDTEGYVSLNDNNNLRIYFGRSIRLFRIGASSTKAEKVEISTLAESDAAKQRTIVDEIAVPEVNGKMLGFIPNPEAPVEDQILALSPILEARKVKDKTVNLEERAAYTIGSQLNPSYANIEFVLQAARVIGKLYGNEANDFLNIPSILESVGVVNLTHIDPSSRRNVPINKSALDCVAWILGYIYREKDLHNMRELNRMFRFILASGLIAKNDIYFDIRQDAGLESYEIKSSSHKVEKVLELMRTPEFEGDAITRHKLLREERDQERLGIL